VNKANKKYQPQSEASTAQSASKNQSGPFLLDLLLHATWFFGTWIWTHFFSGLGHFGMRPATDTAIARIARERHGVQERTRLPLKVTKPGTWKSETYQVPYEEIEA
jgi:hypothetical protein